MPAIPCDPALAREFVAQVVNGLRGAGHETYWAGGCVRDELLGRTPADYDVATAARRYARLLHGPLDDEEGLPWSALPCRESVAAYSLHQ